MSNNDDSFYGKTPVIAVLDNRGLSVREIQYHRHPDTPDTTDERITGHQYDELGFLARSADPRLHALSQADNSVRANFTYLYSLAGEAVRTESVDAGITEAVSDAAGRPFLAVAGIGRDSNGAEERSQAVTRTFQYENAELPGRPLSITEQSAGEAARITERFAYAGNTQAEKDLNLAGQRVRHYDTAGVVQTESVAPLRVTRQLLKDEAVADWQGADASVWNDLLAPELFTTQSMADATGAVLTTTDAKGNVQRLAYDVAGLLSGSWLTLKGAAEQVIVASLTYSAAGQKLREAHGNGVVTTYTYDPETQRLTGIRTERPAGHAAGAKVLQDLRYEYDPVGNVLGIKNDAEETRFWRNQKVVPENAYVYDSLYQLVSASGRERADIAQQGASLPSPVTPLASGDGAFTSYTRTYAYDSGGNLTQMRHGAPASGNGYTTRITVSSRSNRAVLSTLTENPAEVDALFTAGGQQKQLQPGQGLTWTPRGELLQVTPVVRDGATDDGERYRYDAGSQRILKVSTQKTNTSTQAQRVLYLPGLELRTTTGGTTEKEHLHVISVGEAGRAQVRVLHWESGKPDGISNDLLRYSYDNLLGSSGLEVDGSGNIISLEEYYPYGGTAVWTARSAVEADYKTVRYSGKERDATGLYYYGYRYYQPWACRWLSADPAGTVDGLNLYRMVRNNPVTLMDVDGLAPGLTIAERIKKLQQAAPQTNDAQSGAQTSMNRPALRRVVPPLNQNTLPLKSAGSGSPEKIQKHLLIDRVANVEPKTPVETAALASDMENVSLTDQVSVPATDSLFYRGDDRSPEKIKASGGFFARSPDPADVIKMRFIEKFSNDAGTLAKNHVTSPNPDFISFGTTIDSGGYAETRDYFYKIEIPGMKEVPINSTYMGVANVKKPPKILTPKLLLSGENAQNSEFIAMMPNKSVEATFITPVPYKYLTHYKDNRIRSGWIPIKHD